MTPSIGTTPLRHIKCDKNGIPTTRDIPIYTLAGVLAEHLARHRTIDRRVAA